MKKTKTIKNRKVLKNENGELEVKSYPKLKIKQKFEKPKKNFRMSKL